MKLDDLLRTLGLFVRPDVLTAAECSLLVRSASTFSWKHAEVGATNEVAQHVRDTLVADIEPVHARIVHDALRQIRPALEEHFDLSLSSYEGLQLLRYEPGQFFVPHADVGDDPRTAARQVSISILLTDQSDAPGGYAGGGLRFYGSLPNHPNMPLVVPCVPAAGTLVAFHPDLVHEVAPITAGERLSIVTWFHRSES
jgi:predicted 2-oxoglutarate/Fe(II)-dependent dioxygenase YbiX